MRSLVSSSIIILSGIVLLSTSGCGGDAAASLTFVRPTDGQALGSKDDQNSALGGLQYNVQVSSVGLGFDEDVELWLDDAKVGSSQKPSEGGAVFFNNVNFTTGTHTLVAKARQGSVESSEITITADVSGTSSADIAITSPEDGATLNAATPDCDPNAAGVQVGVTLTTNVVDDSEATLKIGDDTSTPPQKVSSGAAAFCVSLPQGTGIKLEASVSDTVHGAATVTISVNSYTQPLADAVVIATSATVGNPRDGNVQFDWTAPAAADGSSLTFVLRCKEPPSAPVTTDDIWNAPGVERDLGQLAPGPQSTTKLVSKRMLVSPRQCAIRGTDAGGNVTPLPASQAGGAIVIDFRRQTINNPSNTIPEAGSEAFGYASTGVGDVNGDGFSDAVLAAGGSAFLYFGSTAGLSGTPTTITGGPGAIPNISFLVSTAGDFNNDGRPDFAVSNSFWNGNRGAVYIFYGRAAGNAWPSTVAVEDGGGNCTADLCFYGSLASGRLGTGMAAAGDFDGDGVQDLALGARGNATTILGTVFIVRGGTGANYASNSNYTLPGSGTIALGGFSINPPVDVPADINNPEVTQINTRRFGISVAAPGDVNGDGKADILIGAPGPITLSVPLEATPKPKVFFVSGRAYAGPVPALDAIVDPAIVLTGDLPTTSLDKPLQTGILNYTIGDFDGNGIVDIGVQPNTAGYSFNVLLGVNSVGYNPSNVVFINNNSQEYATENNGYIYINDAFGAAGSPGWTPSLGSFSDFDGDGKADALLGSAQFPPGLYGAAQIIYGRAVTSMQTINRIPPDTIYQPGDTSSSAQKTTGYLGDINNDGYPDFGVGDYFYSDSNFQFPSRPFYVYY